MQDFPVELRPLPQTATSLWPQRMHNIQPLLKGCLRVIKSYICVLFHHPIIRISMFLLINEITLTYLLDAAYFVVTVCNLHVRSLIRDIHYEVLFGAATWISVIVVKRFGDWPLLKDYLPKTAQFWWLLIGSCLATSVMLLIADFAAIHQVKKIWRTNPHFPYAYVFAEFSLTAVIEEVVYRGYVFSFLQKNYGTTVAVVGSCTTFGGLHLLNGGSYGLVSCILISITSGMLLTGAFVLTKNLYLPIGLHFGYDFAFGLLYGGHHFSPLFLTIPSPVGALFVQLTECYTGVGLLFLAYRRGYWQSAKMGRPKLVR